MERVRVKQAFEGTARDYDARDRQRIEFLTHEGKVPPQVASCLVGQMHRLEGRSLFIAAGTVVDVHHEMSVEWPEDRSGTQCADAMLVIRTSDGVWGTTTRSNTEPMS